MPDTPNSVEELALESLNRFIAAKPQRKIIRFPDVFSRICPLLSIEKQKAWDVLRALKDQGRVEIVPFHGIRILAGDNA